MDAEKLTQDEAQRLLDMVKRSLIAEINFPKRATTSEFDVIGDTKSDVFSISIFRGNITACKYYIGARVKRNGIMLLELHIGKTLVHRNPDGEKIVGSHWHIYQEGFGRACAFAADNIEEDQFVENTIDFLDKFNVVEPPKISYQFEIL